MICTVVLKFQEIQFRKTQNVSLMEPKRPTFFGIHLCFLRNAPFFGDITHRMGHRIYIR